MLQVSHRTHPDYLSIVLEGELDQHGAVNAIDCAEDLLALYPTSRVRLDLSRLSFMDSSGLALVLHLHRTCTRAGIAFSVGAVPPQPMRVFTAAGLPHIIAFEEGRESDAHHS